MRVTDVMSKHPVVCHADTSLHEAAGLMWQQDCGLLPVVDEAAQLVGVITDRDALMGAFMTGRHLTDATVGRSMATHITTCLATDDLAEALTAMRNEQIRRIPVVDEAGRPVGILSINDVIRAIHHDADGRQKTALTKEVVEALEIIGHPRAEAREEGLNTKSTVLPRPNETTVTSKPAAEKATPKKATPKKKARRS